MSILELLTKHNLKSNDAILTEEENIFNDLKEGYQVHKQVFGVLSHWKGNFLIIRTSVRPSVGWSVCHIFLKDRDIDIYHLFIW